MKYDPDCEVVEEASILMRSIDDLGKAIDVAKENVIYLANKLKPVMSVAESPARTECVKSGGDCSPVVSMLKVMIREAESIGAICKEITERLEV